MLLALVEGFLVVCISVDGANQGQGAIFTLIPEFITTGIIYAVTITLVILALRSWLLARHRTWVRWSLLAFLHVLVLVASFFAAIQAAPFTRPLLT